MDVLVRADLWIFLLSSKGSGRDGGDGEDGGDGGSMLGSRWRVEANLHFGRVIWFLVLILID